MVERFTLPEAIEACEKEQPSIPSGLEGKWLVALPEGQLEAWRCLVGSIFAARSG